MWMHQDKIYLFGGYDSIQNVHFNDLWQFDPQTSDWTKIKPTGQGI
jgi:N-acetylneuraminic acid mutarotase